MTSEDDLMTDTENVTAPDRVDAVQSSPWGLLGLAGLGAWLWITAGWAWVVVILALLFMIFMHELGHYLAARRAGMKVTEFFIGFGPKLWSFRRGETEYGIKAIWLGAYVKVIGMNALDEVDPAEEPRTYRQGSYGGRMLLAVAGSAMHFLMAIVMLYVLLVSFGLDLDEADWSVREVIPDSAAAAAGLEPGDHILTIDGAPAEKWSDMVAIVADSPERDVVVGFLRDDQVRTAALTVGVNAETGAGVLGVARTRFGGVEVSPLEAVPETFQTFGSFAGQTVVGIGQIFSPSGIADLLGKVFSSGGSSVKTGTDTLADDDGRIISVVGATRIGASLTEQGVDGLLRFLVSINIFVGIMNMVPLLPLDGGHVAVATYEKVRELQTKQRRYFVDAERLLPLTYAVLMVLAVVGLSAIYLDIADPISL